MIIAGIDPSLSRTAVCTGGAAEHRITVIESDFQGGDIFARFGRYREIATRTVEATAGARIVFLEGYSFASGGRGTVTLGEYGGYLRSMLFESGVEIIEVPPTTLKQFVTGKGNASKSMFASAATRKWGVGENWVEDEFFAYGLYRVGLAYTRQVPVPMNAKAILDKGIT